MKLFTLVHLYETAQIYRYINRLRKLAEHTVKKNNNCPTRLQRYNTNSLKLRSNNERLTTACKSWQTPAGNGPLISELE